MKLGEFLGERMGRVVMQGEIWRGKLKKVEYLEMSTRT